MPEQHEADWFQRRILDELAEHRSMHREDVQRFESLVKDFNQHALSDVQKFGELHGAIEQVRDRLEPWRHLVMGASYFVGITFLGALLALVIAKVKG